MIVEYRSSGATSQSFLVVLQDINTATPATGLTVTNLKLQYTRIGSAAAAAVSATALANAGSAWSSTGMAEVDATNSPGLYRVDFPDAAFAAGVANVVLCVNGAAVHPCYIDVRLATVDANVTAWNGSAVANLSTGYVQTVCNQVNSSAITSSSFMSGAITASAIAAAAIAPAKFDSVMTTGNYVNAQLKATDNIDFSAVQKGSLDASTPANITGVVSAALDESNVSGYLPVRLDVANITGKVPATLAAADVTGAVSANVTQVNGHTAVDGLTPTQALSIILAVLAGKVSGADTSAPVFRAANDTANRVSATTDDSGNRTAVTLNPAS